MLRVGVGLCHKQRTWELPRSQKLGSCKQATGINGSKRNKSPNHTQTQTQPSVIPLFSKCKAQGSSPETRSLSQIPSQVTQSTAPGGVGAKGEECVRPGSAETESKTPLKGGWPHPNSSSANKGVTKQLCPFPGASVSSPIQ